MKMFNFNYKVILCLVLTLSLWSSPTLATDYKVHSPNGDLKATISTAGGLNYAIEKNGETLVAPSQIALLSDISTAETFTKVMKITEASASDDFELVWGTSKHIVEQYNQLNLWFTETIGIEFRMYNEGAAWRYVTTSDEELIVTNEVAEFNFDRSETVYFPHVAGFSNPFEPEYLPQTASDVEEGSLGLTPFMVQHKNQTTVVVSEVNLFSYPGIFITKTATGCSALFPPHAAKEREQFLGRMRLTNIPQLSKKMVKETESYIARKEASSPFPWRTILIADNAKDLLSNNVIKALATKPTSDFAWVKPGKVVWDWYHKWNFDHVDFKAGINTATYKYMIDFAADNKIEYVNIDDGWCKLHNFEKINRDLDLREVIAYAKEKEVGIFLWATWQTLQMGLEDNLDMFAKMGIAGLKVDFFDRCDQSVVDFINTLAEQSAKRKLLLNLHGMYKPTGIEVTYPNVLNLEGVMGLEYNKFSDKCTPQHNLTIPFVRNVVGPMDYTPGGMYYMPADAFEKSWKNPHVMTDRAQQMAMYVVYHGGLQMLADSPSKYLADSVALHFLQDVPVTWDESIPLLGDVGEIVAIARRSGELWYVAAINNAAASDLALPLSFVDAGTYKATIWERGDKVDSLTAKTMDVDNGFVYKTSLVKASGVLMRIEKTER